MPKLTIVKIKPNLYGIHDLDAGSSYGWATTRDKAEEIKADWEEYFNSPLPKEEE